MRQAVLIFVASASFVLAQVPEHGAQPHNAEHGQAEGGHAQDMTYWKWANFAILAGLLGYLGSKHLGPYFRNRGQEIVRGITEASVQKRDAEARLSDIERRMNNMEAEIASLRQQSKEEMAAEGERIRRETEAQLQKIQAQTQQEVDAAVKAAKLELKRYSVDLAIKQAQEQLKGRITPEIDASLIDAFAKDLRDGRNN